MDNRLVEGSDYYWSSYDRAWSLSEMAELSKVAVRKPETMPQVGVTDDDVPWFALIMPDGRTVLHIAKHGAERYEGFAYDGYLRASTGTLRSALRALGAYQGREYYGPISEAEQSVLVRGHNCGREQGTVLD